MLFAAGILVHLNNWPTPNSSNAIITLLAVLNGGIVSILASWWYFWRDQQNAAYLRVVFGGLTGFEDRICELMKSAGTSVQLLLATPLIHSFRYKWIPYTADAFHDHNSDPSYWANKFCKPFVDTIRERQVGGNPLKVEFVFLAENELKNVIAKIPDSPLDWIPYQQSIDFFLEKICEKKVTRIPIVPFYLCLIDCDTGNGATTTGSTEKAGALAPNAQGVVAFISSTSLLDQREVQKRSADEIALQVMAYEFHHPEIVRFFLSQFHHLKNGLASTVPPPSATAVPPP